MTAVPNGNFSTWHAWRNEAKKEHQMDAVTVKSIAGLVIVFLSIFVLIVPLKLLMRSNRIPKMSRIVQQRWVVALQCVRCFSAGGLLGIAFLHLMPDSRDVLAGALNFDSPHNGREFPIPELLFVIGLLICLYIEKGVWSVTDKRSNRRRHSITGSYDFFDSDIGVAIDPDDTSGMYSKRAESDTSINRISGINDASIFTDEPRMCKDKESDDEVFLDDANQMKNNSVPLSLNSSPLLLSGDDSVSHRSGVAFDQCPDAERIIHEAPSLKNTLTSAAVTFYGVFDGIAVGIQRTEATSWVVLASVCIHRCFLAFVLGLEYERPDSNAIHILFGITLFSLFPIVGLIAGATLEVFSRTGVMLKMLGVVQSLTTGAMLYTACFVIIYHEVKQNGNFVPLTATLCGFSGAALTIGILLY